ncbi:hypothetical protein [Jiella pelagia]|uniref:Uncharacterized protein n=1 Tax=Jiella pelagia TaxID=2986949 RepID=A0ABY7BYR8_9HYPH|nr:hypothetical protein [Jiella pelagia]WAP68265.1 hypothetical protein OH818_23400 [Jiella pelagia]
MTSPAETRARIRPVAGRAFEDILDGYFPLEESVRQMMERHRFSTVWITLLHAPIMNLRDLAPTDPVPLTLPKIYSGMIDFMALLGSKQGNRIELEGLGDWFWIDPRDRAPTFPATIRLGEPAFVRGIGLHELGDDPDALTSPREVAVVRPKTSSALAEEMASATAELGWTSSRAFGFGRRVEGICDIADADLSRTLLGQDFTAPTESSDGSGATAPLDEPAYLLVNTSPDQLTPEALKLARRL